MSYWLAVGEYKGAPTATSSRLKSKFDDIIKILLDTKFYPTKLMSFNLTTVLPNCHYIKPEFDLASQSNWWKQFYECHDKRWILSAKTASVEIDLLSNKLHICNDSTPQ